MKVYIGNRTIKDQDFKSVGDISMLKYIADDSECTAIVLDGVIKSLKFSEIPNIINMVFTKLRNGGDLVINDIDFDLLVYAHNKMANLAEMNKMIESVGSLNCLVNYQFILDLFAPYSQLKLVSMELNNLEFRIAYKKA
jgi:hypothetical protein